MHISSTNGHDLGFYFGYRHNPLISEKISVSDQSDIATAPGFYAFIENERLP